MEADGRGWYLGSAEFKAKLLERMEGQLGEHHSGEMRRESAEARAERIIAEELRRRRWSERDLKSRRKGDPEKLELAARLRQQTTLTVRPLAQRLHLGSWKSLNNQLYLRGKRKACRMLYSYGLTRMALTDRVDQSCTQVQAQTERCQFLGPCLGLLAHNIQTRL